jgi:UDP-glucose 4-epimerase
MAKVLVTGGAGYIGSHVVVELVQLGHQVIILDNFCRSDRKTINKINDIIRDKVPCVLDVDICDKERLFGAFDATQPDCVVHLAGLKSIAESFEKPLSYYYNNFCGTVNTLEAMNRTGCKRLIFSSSATVYGVASVPPFIETSPTKPENPYGRTKIFCEELISDWVASTPSGSAVCLRYFNPVGAHPTGIIGDSLESIMGNLFSVILKVIAGGSQSLDIYGDNHETSDGSCVRDFIHVVDLARAHASAIDLTRVSSDFNVINIGTGVGHSVLDVVNAMERASSHVIPLIVRPKRQGDVAVSLASVAKARTLLGWAAHYSLDEMCSSAIKRLRFEETALR